MKKLICYSLILMCAIACKSPEKLYEKGKYKDVVSKLKPKAKKGDLDRSSKGLFIKAVNNYIREENDEIRSSLASSDYKAWEKSKKKLSDVMEEVNEISSFRNIQDDDLDDHQLVGLEGELDQKLFDHYYNKYLDDEELYYKKDERQYIINAYASAERLLEYNADPVFVDSLMNYCLDEGHRYIYYETDCDAFTSFPCRQRFLNRISVNNNVWNTFINDYNEADYKLVVGARIDDKNEQQSKSNRQYSKEVITGYNTYQDSTGTHQEPIYGTIYANVDEITFTWRVRGSAYYELYDNSGSRISSDSFRDEVSQNHSESVFVSGDKDALPPGLNLAFSETRFHDYKEEIDEVYENLARKFRYNIP